MGSTRLGFVRFATQLGFLWIPGRPGGQPSPARVRSDGSAPGSGRIPTSSGSLGSRTSGSFERARPTTPPAARGEDRVGFDRFAPRLGFVRIPSARVRSGRVPGPAGRRASGCRPLRQGAIILSDYRNFVHCQSAPRAHATDMGVTREAGAPRDRSSTESRRARNPRARPLSTSMRASRQGGEASAPTCALPCDRRSRWSRRRADTGSKALCLACGPCHHARGIAEQSFASRCRGLGRSSRSRGDSN
jgi:hypothetical protein